LLDLGANLEYFIFAPQDEEDRAIRQLGKGEPIAVAKGTILLLCQKNPPKTYNSGAWRHFSAPSGCRWHLDEVSEAIDDDLSPQYLQS
jgi:hypothetical protein